LTAFADTNVLVYAFDDDAPEKQAVARSLVAREPPTISMQVLQEFYWVVTRRLGRPVPPRTARVALRRLAAFPVFVPRPEHVLSAAEVAEDSRIAFWDALIVVAAAAAGCDVLLSEDLRTDGEILGVQIRNPFAGAV
jgi:predicted nucleic acid-binding protein